MLHVIAAHGMCAIHLPSAMLPPQAEMLHLIHQHAKHMQPVRANASSIGHTACIRVKLHFNTVTNCI